MDRYLETLCHALSAHLVGRPDAPSLDTLELPHAIANLAERLQLSHDEAHLLALTCAPHYAPEVAIAYASLLQLTGSRKLCIALLARMLGCSHFEIRKRFHSVFVEPGPLLTMQLLRVSASGELEETPECRGLLFERRTLPHTWDRFAQHRVGHPPGPLLDPEVHTFYTDVELAWSSPHSPPPITYLVGPAGVGHTCVARNLAAARSQSLIEVEVSQCPDATHPMVFVREARWLGAALLFRFTDSDAFESWRPLIDACLAHDVSVLVSLSALSHARSSTARRSVLLNLPRPHVTTRKALWDRLLPQRFRGPELTSEWLAFRFRGTGRDIAELAVQAIDLAALRHHERPPRVTRETLETLARRTLTTQLDRLAARCRPLSTGLRDVILGDTQREQLEELTSRVRHRMHVLENWGFGDMGYGIGTVALLSGAPGTGKTLSARAVCSELHIPLYRIDLSQVVSKWVGETEKHLAILFDEAERSGAALLFDEADVLFTRRGEVQGGGDSYANLKVGYLLQRIEAFSGLCFLTTNLGHSIDAAFIRRMSVHVRYDMPEPDERLAIWESVLPPQAPIHHNVDLQTLADKLDAMSGGDIRTAAMRAAFIAREHGLPITQAMLEYASGCTLLASGALVRFEKPETWMAA